MTRHPQLDLFRPTDTQLDLLDDLDARPSPVFLPDPAEVRARVTALVETARGASELPWPAGEAAYHRTVVPQMCNWLPEAEAAELRAAFAAELARLGFA